MSEPAIICLHDWKLHYLSLEGPPPHNLYSHWQCGHCGAIDIGAGVRLVDIKDTTPLHREGEITIWSERDE